MVNREIKFRGICKNTRKFVYGNYIEKIDPTKERPTFWASLIHDRALTTTVVISDTVGQYTGLKDKNGKEIYENDIISDGNTKFRVYSVAGGFAIKAPYWASCMEDFKFGDELIIQPLADAQTMSYIKESCTVIGNIHETPELLNK